MYHSKFRSLLAIGVMLCLVIGGSSVAFAEGAAPAYSFSTGHSSSYQFSIAQQSSLTTGGDATSFSVVISGDMAWKVTSVSDSAIVLALRFENVKSAIERDGTSLSGRQFEWVVDALETVWTVAPDGTTKDFLVDSSSPRQARTLRLLFDALLAPMPVVPTSLAAGGSTTGSGGRARIYSYLGQVAAGHKFKLTSASVDAVDGTELVPLASVSGEVMLTGGKLTEMGWSATTGAASGDSRLKTTVTLSASPKDGAPASP